MGEPAGSYSSRTCISLRLHGKGWTGRVGSGGKMGRQLSEVYCKTSNTELVSMAVVVKFQLRQCANTAETSGM